MIKVWEGVGVEVTMSWVKAVTIDSCLCWVTAGVGILPRTLHCL